MFLKINNKFYVFRKEKSVIEAVYVGTSHAIPIVARIAANLISVLAILALLDGFLSWLGGLTNYPELAFHVRF